MDSKSILDYNVDKSQASSQYPTRSINQIYNVHRSKLHLGSCNRPEAHRGLYQSFHHQYGDLPQPVCSELRIKICRFRKQAHAHGIISVYPRVKSMFAVFPDNTE